MGTSVMVPLEEYLRTSYERDCEWVDGVVKERGMPDGYHGYFQGFFLAYFAAFKDTLRALLEVRFCDVAAKLADSRRDGHQCQCQVSSAADGDAAGVYREIVSG